MRTGVALALFAFTLASRLPFRVEHLYEHDSVLYARAVESFDPTSERPHPPGYLWYVLLIRAVMLLTRDANAAMTLVSAVAAAASVALLYVLGSRLYDEVTGRIAALFLLTSVTFWARGVVAYPYTLLAGLTILIALLFWRVTARPNQAPTTLRERGRNFVIAGVAWGIASGFRPDLAIVLAPLWLLVAAMSGIAIRHILYSAVAAATGGALWLTMSGAATPGGLVAFLSATSGQAGGIATHLSLDNSAAAEISRNVRSLTRFLGRALYAVMPFFLVFVFASELRRAEAREPRRLGFLLLWALAPVPLYVFVHVGEYGYVFTMLPGLMILAARGAIGVTRAVRWPRALPQLAGAAVLANAAIFLLSDSPLSAHDLARRDRGIGEKAAWVRANVDPRGAIIVTAYDKVLVEHYIGTDYRIVEHEPGPAPEPGPPPLCAALDECPHVVILWDELFVDGEEWRVVAMPSGARLRVAEVDEAAALRLRERRRPVRRGG